VLGEKVWTELHIIVKVKGPTCLEALAEVGDGYRLFILSYAPELLVRVLRQARRPTTTTAVMC
jgi:hypothetical protein